MSMYKDYIETQLDNRFVFESEYGFMTYNYQQDFLQIEEIYIKEEYRRQGKASEMYEICEGLARKRVGITKLKGSIVIGTNGAEESMICLFKNGFHLSYNSGMIIFLIKEIGE